MLGRCRIGGGGRSPVSVGQRTAVLSGDGGAGEQHRLIMEEEYWVRGMVGEWRRRRPCPRRTTVLGERKLASQEERKVAPEEGTICVCDMWRRAAMCSVTADWRGGGPLALFRMASKQMEEIQRKLSLLSYPRANVPSQSLLYAGVERYSLLEWLFFRLLGDRSPFTQQNWQGDIMDRDEETARIQYLAEMANFLGILPTIDTEAIQGRGSYEERAELLHLVVDLVEATCYADNPDWSVDEQLAKDVQLLDSIAEKQAQIFSEEFKLFPADVQIQSIYPLPDIGELESKLSDHSKKLSSLQQMVEDLASKYEYNPNEEYAETELKLRRQLESFLETVRSFNLIYTKEIRPWTNMMEVPQLHGFGPAANRLLEAYNTLLKFLGNLRSLREAHAAMAGGADSMSNEPSSVTKLILDCESALTFLNRNLAILSTSVAREQAKNL